MGCAGSKAAESAEKADIASNIEAQPVQGSPVQQNLQTVQVPPGLQGGMQMQAQTPAGAMWLTIPDGLQAGATFQFQVPSAAPLMAQPPMAMPQQPMAQPVMMAGGLMPVDTTGDGRADTMMPVGGGMQQTHVTQVTQVTNVTNVVNQVQPAPQPAPVPTPAAPIQGAFENRKFEGNNKYIQTSGGTTRLYFDGNGGGSRGAWLTPAVFACSPCPFGPGTWAVACDDDGARTCYLGDRKGLPKDAAGREELAEAILDHAQAFSPWKDA